MSRSPERSAPGTPASLRRTRAVVLAALLAAILAAAPAGAASAPSKQAAKSRAPAGAPRFDALVDEFFERWFAFHPDAATRLGLHRWDDQLPPLTQASVQAESTWLRGFQTRLRSLSPTSLSFPQLLDRATLDGWIERQCFDLEVVRSWERNPNTYVGLVTSPVQSLLQREFAPDCARVRSAARRLRMVPEILRAAKINLRHPPLRLTEIALDQARGALRFYRETVPALSARCHDAITEADLAEADTAAVRATEDFVRFLDEDLRPRSDGVLALGRDVYQRKLWADEMDRTPIDSLLARGRAELARTRARMAELAARIAPSGGVQAALDSIDSVHPSPENQIAFVTAEIDTVRAFLKTHDIVTRPASEHLIVRETPLFARSTSFASLDPPGVWENGADEAFFNVTPVDPHWSESQQRDHLEFFNRWNTAIVTIHEGLPGHYYQFLALKRVRSRVRAALGCRSNIEGWAHYCEQMMLEQGFAAGDARTELAQQWLALQRLGRLIVGLSLHTGGMTEAEATAFFEQQCWMSPITAAREARRGAIDPTYLVYTLGKWRILELRDEVRAALGDRYSARAFHDALLAQGSAPLPIVRAGVLHTLAGRTVRIEEP
ncbi:MAG TPA: DUF885 domain-containing protein [Candidatus Udaeobacter sp.]|jgi:uncharacterized protein (DUF885 family)|nr:DUF885 domain-containing protein [Candidatus Udaeobacter sp.]